MSFQVELPHIAVQVGLQQVLLWDQIYDPEEVGKQHDRDGDPPCGLATCRSPGGLATNSQMGSNL
jgi:hypothetical protein